MTRAFAVFFFLLTAMPALAAGLELRSSFLGDLTMLLEAETPPAYRIGYSGAPARLVLDVQVPEIAITTGDDKQVEQSDVIPLSAGWTRVELHLKRPQVLYEARTTDTGLELRFKRTNTSGIAFAAKTFPITPVTRREASERVEGETFRVTIDPGHGGIDAGAVRGGVSEKVIALQVARRIMALAGDRPALELSLTRKSDRYLGLRERVAIARDQQAGLFLSIHANTVLTGRARGAAAYLLSDIASDAETEALARRENRTDILGPGTLAGTTDLVAATVISLTQRQTNTASREFAQSLIETLRPRVEVLRSRPIRSADFRVLRSPEIPSVLLELGFLSDPEDRANMTDPDWQDRAALSILDALDQWATGQRTDAIAAE